MKLVLFATLISSVTIKAQTQKIHHEQLPLPPQFQRPFNGAFQTDNSLYLPPENHSPLPYFPMKNIDRLQFQYLPASGTKAPPIYQTPFPLIISSMPNFDDDDSDNDENDVKLKPTPQSSQNPNRTDSQGNNKKDMRALPQTVLYRHPIDRADTKIPFQMGNFGPHINQNPANRRMIMTSETKRSDHVPDQVKAATFQGPQFVSPPYGVAVPTTEPAIPILRLSNEMDLDGSYSYEALGADQTHYVQHSRMENMGTEKEEQVVEGSYSYVGDNGQTYTVHYVADSNGFRASGDHLPVAPPVPEIIQRAVQYNLAEEAKRPPHQKSSWQDDEGDNGFFERDKNHHFVLPAQQQNVPPRNLFTGRKPEAFSYSYSQGSQQEENNMAVAASNQVPVKTVDLKKEPVQNKPNGAPIAPQITFLASQGAHVPSVNAPPQPSISRMFTSERLPQLMNYEATFNDKDQENKALWRWQYGMNGNGNTNTNDTPAKSTISRSSGDDVMINFNDMTQEQYTNMIRSQLDTENDNGNGVEVQPNRPQDQSNIQNNQNVINEYEQQYQNQQNQYQNYLNQHNANLKQQQLDYVNNEYTKNNQQNKNENYQQYQNQKQYTNQNQNYYSQPSQQYSQTNYDTTLASLNSYQSMPEPTTSTTTTTTTTQAPAPQKVLKHDPQPQQAYNNNQHRYPVDRPVNNVKNIESRNLVQNNYHPGLLTRHHFIPPSQTITQSYDYDGEDYNNDDLYEARKMKSYNLDTLKILSSTMTPVMETLPQQNDQMQNKQATKQQVPNYSTQTQSMPTQNYDVSSMQPIYNHNTARNDPVTEAEVKTTAFPVYIPSSTKASFKFSDFIVNQPDEGFSPVTNAVTEPKEQSTTTTEASIENMLENNIFLKNMFKTNKNEAEKQNSIKEETKPVDNSKPNPPEQKIEKPSKQSFSKSFQYTKTENQKPLDFAQVLHYVANKNGFEPIKIKPKNKPIPVEPQSQSRSEIYYSNSEEIKSHERENLRHILSPRQHEELRGVIKNYKVLQRNNHVNHEHNQYKPEYNQPIRYVELQPSNTPPLGRAGPTVKAYLPPIYV